MNKAKNEKDKNYYLNGIILLLKKDETFNNYKSEQNKDFTNRKNELEKEQHGNIGVTTSVSMLNEDINFRLQHTMLNTVVDMFIAEYGFLA